ncbi:MAG: ribonuclease H-like domain-containing protein, partial [Candidatus Heimdallarchaeota archaeon]|nr:ribonuclease H-like domain-containing protein [Candidatus Heimdallarchaeota archaeon]
KLFQELNLEIFDKIPSLSGISSIPFDQFLFIDTETTGLAGGAGTYVFLIGAAKFVNEDFQFAQFFLQDPANELAQLAALEKFCSSAKVIISYNGKSFDLPRLQTRYRFHGWPPPFKDILHIDLLHIARRLWKSHLASCTLGDIEYHLLGVTRSSLDIPGWQVASLFFDYLQNGDPTPLSSVFYHNEVDVISLITLLNYITNRLSLPLADQYQSLEDLVSVGICLAHYNRIQSAQSVLSHAVNNIDLPDHLYLTAMSKLASIYKKTGDYSQAVPIWETIASQNMLHANTELAMYYEHKKNDYQEAIHWTLSAVEILSVNPISSQSEKTRASLEHRLSRLKRKSAKLTK